MKNQKYIARKKTKIASILLMLHLLVAPILASTPHISCDDECNVFMGEMRNTDTSGNQMNDGIHSCCMNTEKENNDKQTKKNACDLQIHVAGCEMKTEFNSVEITTVNFKFDPKPSLTQVAFLDETEESFSSEFVYFFGQIKLNGPPIYIAKSSFLN